MTGHESRRIQKLEMRVMEMGDELSSMRGDVVPLAEISIDHPYVFRLARAVFDLPVHTPGLQDSAPSGSGISMTRGGQLLSHVSDDGIMTISEPGTYQIGTQGAEVHDMGPEIVRLTKLVSDIGSALGAYPDSDLVGLAKALRAEAEASTDARDLVMEQRDARIAELEAQLGITESIDSQTGHLRAGIREAMATWDMSDGLLDHFTELLNTEPKGTP